MRDKKMEKMIKVEGGRENNLKNVQVSIPHHKLTVVCGVSGSGKTSLVFDTLYREGQRRFLEAFSGYSRQFMGKSYRPDADSIKGILPSIAVEQKSMMRSSRSTVGTISGVYDYLRLLFARLGEPAEKLNIKVNRSLFSFNSPSGCCPECKGLGVTDRISQRLIVSNENKSLSQGALAITAPNGYIIYSQVTMEVLNQVCNTHGFSVDIPWKDLSEQEKYIVMYGSDRIKIPYGKHTLESRMKWSGITAKPREEGVYKGIIPVMQEILKRDRNDNILRFAETLCCEHCNGRKLHPEALMVKIKGFSIAELCEMTVEEMWDVLNGMEFNTKEQQLSAPILKETGRLAGLFKKLRLDYLSLSRESTTLSGGEMQRLKLLGLTGSGISNLLYVFDEPGAGLHPADTQNLIQVLDDLLHEGNTVVVVAHDEDIICNADYLVDVGPGAGERGGHINFQGNYRDFIQSDLKSITHDYILGKSKINYNRPLSTSQAVISFKGIEKHNLKNIDVDIKLNRLNVVTGVSGAGKSTLVKGVIFENLKNLLSGQPYSLQHLREIRGFEQIKKVIETDQSPIGKTLRSNPATYTGLSDKIRDLFATQKGSKDRKWNKSRFSFNTAGGRCEDCLGAGVKSIGMHFMGNLNTLCETCSGKRFKPEVLEITYKGLDISQVYELSVSEALDFFTDEKPIRHYLEVLKELGLGYIRLGQPSNTLSGGEAQRLKLAEELVKQHKQPSLFIFDEPATGLHFHDINKLLRVFERIIRQGHTLLLIEHNSAIISLANHIIDLGPGSGPKGGSLVFMGSPSDIIHCKHSITGRFMNQKAGTFKRSNADASPNQLRLTGIRTHNLKNLNLSIDHNQIVAFAGVSGSGKSSLVYDTIYAEAAHRFSLNLSAYLRSFLPNKRSADFETATGLSPAIAIDKKRPTNNPRSLLVSFTGIFDYIRLLYSRFGTDENGNAIKGLRMSNFSFNHEAGACPCCKGLGKHLECEPLILVSHPEKSLMEGALNGSKAGKFYGEPDGQYVATLLEVGKTKGIDFNKPYKLLTEEEKAIAMHGCGEEIFEVKWNYKRKNVQGTHTFKGKWPGFANLVNDEFLRKHQDERGEQLLHLMVEKNCPDCEGQRIKPQYQAVCYNGISFSSLMNMDVEEALMFFSGKHPAETRTIIDMLTHKLNAVKKLGLGYVALIRETASLSSGEWQRLKIAAHLHEGLTGITYIMDEPSNGLNTRNVEELMEVLNTLKQQGNSIIITEHNPQVLRQSDCIVELGPEAGKQGGEILYCGRPKNLLKSDTSILKHYLNREWKNQAKPIVASPRLEIKGAYAHNLKNIDVEFYAGMLNVITGVSGSGKSSLLYDVIFQSLINSKAISCHQFICKRHQPVFLISDEAVTESRRSTPLSFTWIDDELFRETARNNDQKASLKATSLSFNSREGQCPACKGMGKTRVPMDFIADVWTVCESCLGRRFNDDILKFTYKGLPLDEILELSFQEAAHLYSSNKSLKDKLDLFCQLGLGYLKLNQDFASVSSGELQRIKLIKVLFSLDEPGILLMDEPASGLHFRDIEKLMQLMTHLLSKGHTIIAIEHNQQFISFAGHILSLGPGGGRYGGERLQ